MNVFSVLQACTGLLFACFLTVHLLNTAAASMGQQFYDSLQANVRVVYQHPIVEGAILFAVVGHIGLGAYRAQKRFWPDDVAAYSTRKKTEAPPLIIGQRKENPLLKFLSPHILSGWVIAPLIVGHVYACRFSGSPHFAGLAFLARHKWIGLLFTLYLAVFGCCGVVHLYYGVPKALRLLGVKGIPHPPLLIVVLGALVVLMGVLTIGGFTWWSSDKHHDFSEAPYAEILRKNAPWL